MKDHYSILELPPSASLDEVKKAYRRLAHQYHPDKKGNDPYAAAQFAEIKEAYETLSNPVRKDHYLQQRWYAQSTGQKITQQIVTPVTLLKRMLELDKYTSQLDTHRMDKEGLYEYINAQFSSETIEKINSFNEPDINKGIVYAALRSSRHLNYAQVTLVSHKLLKLKIEEPVIGSILQHVEHARQEDTWNKYKPWVVLSVVLLLSALILLLSR